MICKSDASILVCLLRPEVIYKLGRFELSDVEKTVKKMGNVMVGDAVRDYVFVLSLNIIHN